MGGKTGYPVSWYTNDKEEGNFMEIEATSADRNLLLEQFRSQMHEIDQPEV